jgi:hypothetical protein
MISKSTERNHIVYSAMIPIGLRLGAGSFKKMENCDLTHYAANFHPAGSYGTRGRLGHLVSQGFPSAGRQRAIIERPPEDERNGN